MTYRKGEREEAAKYTFRYIPHIVIADSQGNELDKYEARSLANLYKTGNFSETIVSKALEVSR